jgi:hypothetical protein
LVRPTNFQILQLQPSMTWFPEAFLTVIFPMPAPPASQ